MHLYLDSKTFFSYLNNNKIKRVTIFEVRKKEKQRNLEIAFYHLMPVVLAGIVLLQIHVKTLPNEMECYTTN